MDRPIILCGLGRVGWRVLEYLRAADLPVVVVDTKVQPDDPRLGNVRLVKGDSRRRETLEQAGVRDCGGVIVLTSNDLVNVSTTLMVRSIHPEVRIVLRVFNENLIGRLGQAIHNIFPLSTSSLIGPLVAVKALTGQALGAFRVERADVERRQVAEMTLPGGSPLAGHALGQVLARYNVQAVVHVPVNGVERFLHQVDPQAKLQPGDYLCVVGEPGDVAPLLSAGRESELTDLRWSSLLRRLGRTVWRTFREIDLSVKVSAVILLVVVLAGTVFFLTWRSDRVADAVYHTISVIATMSDMRSEGDRQEIKVFVSILRIVGAALMATFTAILTNYLLRASLSGALEVRRIPDSGHVIVCGLGNIGFRIVEELVRAHEKVVVIEVSRDNRFVTTVRRQGVAVILGDATIEEVMRQAHAPEARAVVACTDNDMINLEIALLARELNPNERVVLLQTDPQMAELLRVAANVRLAVSVPNLAAPAFAAALFGDRVQSVFIVQERMLAVVDLVIGAQDTHLIGQSGRTVSLDHHVLPVAVIPADNSPPSRNALNACLAAGDRLVAVVELKDLENLLRRRPAPAEWSVEVTGFELAAREWLHLYVQTSNNLSEEEAERALNNLPFCLEANLTRGQAVDLVALLEREHVDAAMRRVPTLV